MITLDQWQAVLTVVTPVLLSLLFQQKWTKKTKLRIAMAASVFVAFVPEFIAGNLANPATFTGEAITIFIASQGIYHLWCTQFDALTAKTDVS